MDENGMTTGNLVFLAIVITLLLLAIQRAEARRRLLTAAILVIPVGWLVYRWAIYRGQVTETLIAGVIGLVLNGLFWVFYGRKHPPGSSEEIRVIGMED
jgi:hypothetical protein